MTAPVTVQARAVARTNNLRNLVERLRESPTQPWGIAGFLQFSASGARKYINELGDAGVIVIDSYPDQVGDALGQPAYSLTTDAKRVAEWRARLDAGEFRGSHWPRPKKPEFALADPSGGSYIKRDDVRYGVVGSKKPPKSDRLVSLLFGTAPVADSCVEQMENFPEPVRAVKLTAWEALMLIRFELPTEGKRA